MAQTLSNEELTKYLGALSETQNSKLDADMSNTTETGTRYISKVSMSSDGSSLEIGDIGLSIFVDESKGLRRYLNGSMMAFNENTQDFFYWLQNLKTIKPEYFVSEQVWQAESAAAVDGCVYKFVLDEENLTIRLPKYPEYVEINAPIAPVVGNGMAVGLTDGTNYGGLVAESQRNLQGRVDNYGKDVGTAYASSTMLASKAYGLTTDGSKSGIEADLNQTKLKLYYFIQIASGLDTHADIVNKIQLNNPYSLGDSKYSPQELNNVSWLKSAGQWNSKTIYTSFYNNFATKIGESFGLGFVKESTGSYDDYDLVINTSDETFRLPLLDGSESIVSDQEITLTAGASPYDFTIPRNGIVYASVTRSSTNYQLVLNNGKIVQKGTTSTNTSNNTVVANLECRKDQSIRLTYSGTVSKFVLNPYIGNGSLYYYVGETVQSANLIDAGRMQEALIMKTNMEAANITSLGMPNWKKSYVYEVPNNVMYTTLYDGKLNGVIVCGTNAGGSFIDIYDENGILVNSNIYGYSGVDANQFFVDTYIPKGYSVKITTTGTIYYSTTSHQQIQGKLQFIPLKGVS